MSSFIMKGKFQMIKSNHDTLLLSQAYIIKCPWFQFEERKIHKIMDTIKSFEQFESYCSLPYVEGRAGVGKNCGRYLNRCQILQGCLKLLAFCRLTAFGGGEVGLNAPLLPFSMPQQETPIKYVYIYMIHMLYDIYIKLQLYIIHMYALCIQLYV